MESSGDDKLDLLIAEYMERIDRGDQVDVDQFLQPHQGLADEFRSYLRDVRAIDDQASPDAEANRSQDTNPSMVVDETLAQRPNRPEYDSNESLPRAFGRYRLMKELGRGAMGTVYLAEDTELKREVALKQPRFAAGEERAMLERFYREAQAAATLNHPNICPVHDIGEHDGTPYITMAYVQGRTLAEILRGGRGVNERSAAILVRKISLALSDAHGRGIVHRDLKPGNIMINERNEPIVMDFGLARQFEMNADTRLTQEGMLVGTPTYMSPEQVECDDQRIGPQSDIYSLGVVFYEMLTGQVPFSGSVAKVIAQIVRDDPPNPSSFRAGVSPKADEICMQMIRKSQEHRFASMNDVADALAGYLKNATESVASPAPNESPISSAAKLKQQADRVHKLIANGKWLEAENALQTMAADPDPVAANYVTWANEQLVTVRQRIEQERTAANSMVRRAQSMLDRHEYADAAGLLVKIETPFQTQQAKLLLQESVEKQTQVDHTFSRIERDLRTGETSKTMQQLQRLVQLKPNDPIVEYLFRKYRWQSRFGGLGGRLADAFAPAAATVSRPDYEEPFLRKHLALSAVIFLLFCGLTATGVTIYIKQSGKLGKVAINVTDDALAKGDIEMTVQSLDATSGNSYDVPAEHISDTLASTVDAPVTPLPEGEPEFVKSLQGHKGNVHRVQFSPSGDKLASISGIDGTLKAWDVATGTIRFSVNVGVVYAMDIDASGKYVAISAQRTPRIYDMQSGQLLVEFPAFEDYPLSAAFSSGSKYLALHGRGGEGIKVYDISQLKQGTVRIAAEFEGGESVWANSVTFLPDGEHLLAGSPEAAFGIRLLHVPSSRIVRHYLNESGQRESSNLLDCSIHPSGEEFIIRSGNSWRLKRYQVADETILRRVSGEADNVRYSPSGEFLICSHRSEDKPNTLAVRSAADGATIWQTELTDYSPKSLDVSPDGRFVAISTEIHDEAGNLDRDAEAPIHIWRLPKHVWPKLTMDATSDLGKIAAPKVEKVSEVEKVSDTFSVPREPMNGLNFDGNDHIQIPDYRYGGQTPLTVEALVQLDADFEKAAGAGMIVSSNQAGGFWISIFGRTLQFHLFGEKSGKLKDIGTVYRLEADDALRPIHLAGVYDDHGVMNFYVDGKAVGTIDVPGAHKPSHRPVYIGADPDIDGSPAKSGFFTGRIFMVRISNRVRYTEDFSVPSEFTADGSTECLYKMDEGDGDTIHDSSKHARHAKIVGATWIKEGDSSTTEVAKVSNTFAVPRKPEKDSPPPFEPELNPKFAENLRGKLLAHYQFEGNLRELAGRGSQILTFKRPEFRQNALRVDGTYRAASAFSRGLPVDLAVFSVPALDSRKFTVILRARAESDSGRPYLIGGNINRWFCFERNDDGTLRVGMDSWKWRHDFKSTKIESNRWYVLTCGVDLASRKCVVTVDGRIAETVKIPSSVALDSSAWQNPAIKIEQKAFTVTNSLHGESFEGRFDEVMVCDHLLTDAELSQLIKR